MIEEELEMAADILKFATREATEYILSGELTKDSVGDINLISRVEKIAKNVFATIVAISSTPLWVLGEVCEVLSGKPKRTYEIDAKLPNTPLSEITLDPNKTTYLNVPISTYQNSSDRNFCANSDWGKYAKQLFNEEKGTDHLGPWHGKGIDILTDEGLEYICDKTLDMGANSVRFSVEWADVEKNEGEFDHVAMQKYINIAKKIREKGLEPLVVLHHFVTPLDEKGRNVFESYKSIDRFVDFATFAYENLKDDVSCFFTFNEPNVVANCNYVLGMFPMQQVGRFDLYQTTMKNMLTAHKRVYEKLHQMAGKKKITVGLTHSTTCFIPSSRWNILARITAFSMTHIFHDAFMRWAQKNIDHIDLLGLQYYSRAYIGGIVPTSTCKKGERMIEEMKYRFDPKGLLPVLRDVNEKLNGKLDLMVSETGVAGENSLDAPSEMDDLRQEYLEDSCKCSRSAQDENIPVVGHGVWGAFLRPSEWREGNAVDFSNVARDPKAGKTRDTKGYTAIQTIYHNTAKLIAQLVKKAS